MRPRSVVSTYDFLQRYTGANSSITFAAHADALATSPRASAAADVVARSKRCNVASTGYYQELAALWSADTNCEYTTGVFSFFFFFFSPSKDSTLEVANCYQTALVHFSSPDVRLNPEVHAQEADTNNTFLCHLWKQVFFKRAKRKKKRKCTPCTQT